LNSLGRVRDDPDGYLQHDTLAAAAISWIGRGHEILRKVAAFAASSRDGTDCP
jgi:hypothetical protein